MSEFGGNFFGLERKTVLHTFKNVLFSAHTKRKRRCCAASLTTQKSCLRPSVHGGARRVSGPALVRTAPALPTPWNPNLHAPAICTSLTANPANHGPGAASTSPPTPAILGRGKTVIGWCESRGPMTPSVIVRPPMEWLGEAMQEGSGSRWSYV